VVVVHPHGLDHLPIPETIEVMAADRIRALRAARPHGPYFVGGYCNGALVAFEMARQLLAQGEQVPAVIVIEARAPTGDHGGAAADADDRHVQFGAGGFRLLVPSDRPTDVQLRYTRAIERYAGDRFAGHVVIIRSRHLDDVRPELEWTRLGASAENHVLPGNHVSLVTRHTAALARTVRAAIERVPERVDR